MSSFDSLLTSFSASASAPPKKKARRSPPTSTPPPPTPPLVSFLMLGMQKAGTSWFHKMLSTHPSINMPNGSKEVHYWDMNFEKGKGWYETQWQSPAASQPLVCGEVTPDYMNLNASAVADVHRYNPNMRLVLCVRDEIERVWSSFMMYCRNSKKTVGEMSDDEVFERLVREDYATRCDYGNGIENYLKLFQHEQLLLVDFEDVKERPRELCREVFQHLGVDGGHADVIRAEVLGSNFQINKDRSEVSENEKNEVPVELKERLDGRLREFYKDMVRNNKKVLKAFRSESVNEGREVVCVKVYGERNCGTNYLQELMRRNLNADLRPMEYGEGWKHGFPDEKCVPKSRREKAVFIVVLRDVGDWLRSTFKRPYHMERAEDFNLFVERAIVVEEVRSDHPVVADARERDVTILELYKRKVEAWREFVKGRRGVVVSLGYLQRNGEQFLKDVCSKYGVRMGSDFYRPLEIHTKTKEKYVEDKGEVVDHALLRGEFKGLVDDIGGLTVEFYNAN